MHSSAIRGALLSRCEIAGVPSARDVAGVADPGGTVDGGCPPGLNEAGYNGAGYGEESKWSVVACCPQLLRGLATTFLVGAAFAVSAWAEPLTFEPAEVNFGTKAQGLTLTADVKMTNTSAKELHVLNVSSDCSCTAGEPRQQRLAPGESTTIPVSLQTKAFLGPLMRRLTVHTTEGDGELRVKATIRPFEHWEVIPNPVVLPTSRRDQEVGTQVTATYQGAETRSILEVATDQPWLRAEMGAAPSGSGRIVQLRKLSTAPAGPHTALLTLTTDDPGQPRLTLKVFVPVMSAVKVSPNPVILPTTRVGAVATREVVVSGWEEVTPPTARLANGVVAARGRRPNGDFVFAVSVTPTTAGMQTQLVQFAAGPYEVVAEVSVIVKADP